MHRQSLKGRDLRGWRSGVRVGGRDGLPHRLPKGLLYRFGLNGSSLRKLVSFLMTRLRGRWQEMAGDGRRWREMAGGRVSVKFRDKSRAGSGLGARLD